MDNYDKVKQIAKKLDGTSFKIAKEIIQEASENNILIVFPESDDLIEFRGVITDETGHEAYLKNGKILVNECCNTCCPYYEEMLRKADKIECYYTETSGWNIKSDTLKGEVFRIIDDDDEMYGQGLVITV